MNKTICHFQNYTNLKPPKVSIYVPVIMDVKLMLSGGERSNKVETYWENVLVKCRHLWDCSLSWPSDYCFTVRDYLQVIVAIFICFIIWKVLWMMLNPVPLNNFMSTQICSEKGVVDFLHWELKIHDELCCFQICLILK